MDEVHDLLRSPLHTSSDGWAYIPHLASEMGIRQQHISMLFPSRCLMQEPYADIAPHQGAPQQRSMLLTHQRCRLRETYERRGLYLRAVPTGAADKRRETQAYATAVCGVRAPTATPSRRIPSASYETSQPYLREVRAVPTRAALIRRESHTYATTVYRDGRRSASACSRSPRATSEASGAYLRAERMRAPTTTRTHRNDFDDVCTDNDPQTNQTNARNDCRRRSKWPSCTEHRRETDTKVYSMFETEC